jgi:hypothetical protein
LKECWAKENSEQVKDELRNAIDNGSTRLDKDSLRTFILKYHFNSAPVRKSETNKRDNGVQRSVREAEKQIKNVVESDKQ